MFPKKSKVGSISPKIWFCYFDIKLDPLNPKLAFLFGFGVPPPLIRSLLTLCAPLTTPRSIDPLPTRAIGDSIEMAKEICRMEVSLLRWMTFAFSNQAAYLEAPAQPGDLGLMTKEWQELVDHLAAKYADKDQTENEAGALAQEEEDIGTIFYITIEHFYTNF